MTKSLVIAGVTGSGAAAEVFQNFGTASFSDLKESVDHVLGDAIGHENGASSSISNTPSLLEQADQAVAELENDEAASHKHKHKHHHHKKHHGHGHHHKKKHKHEGDEEHKVEEDGDAEQADEVQQDEFEDLLQDTQLQEEVAHDDDEQHETHDDDTALHQNSHKESVAKRAVPHMPTSLAEHEHDPKKIIVRRIHKQRDALASLMETNLPGGMTTGVDIQHNLFNAPGMNPVASFGILPPDSIPPPPPGSASDVLTFDTPVEPWMTHSNLNKDLKTNVDRIEGGKIIREEENVEEVSKTSDTGESVNAETVQKEEVQKADEPIKLEEVSSSSDPVAEPDEIADSATVEVETEVEGEHPRGHTGIHNPPVNPPTTGTQGDYDKNAETADSAKSNQRVAEPDTAAAATADVSLDTDADVSPQVESQSDSKQPSANLIADTPAAESPPTKQQKSSSSSHKKIEAAPHRVIVVADQSAESATEEAESSEKPTSDDDSDEVTENLTSADDEKKEIIRDLAPRSRLNLTDDSAQEEPVSLKRTTVHDPDDDILEELGEDILEDDDDAVEEELSLKRTFPDVDVEEDDDEEDGEDLIQPDERVAASLLEGAFGSGLDEDDLEEVGEPLLEAEPSSLLATGEEIHAYHFQPVQPVEKSKTTFRGSSSTKPRSRGFIIPSWVKDRIYSLTDAIPQQYSEWIAFSFNLVAPPLLGLLAIVLAIQLINSFRQKTQQELPSNIGAYRYQGKFGKHLKRSNNGTRGSRLYSIAEEEEEDCLLD